MATPDPYSTGGDRDPLDELRASFLAAEEYIAALVHGIAVAPEVARAIRLARARAAGEFVGQVAAALRRESRDYLRQHMPAVYLQGMVHAAQTAPTAVPLEWTLLHKRAVSILVADTFADVAAATRYMQRQAKAAIRDAAKAEALRQVTTGRGNRAERLAAELELRAVTAFRDRAGRKWRLSRYADMVLRTKRQAAYNTGAVLRHQQQGTPGMRIVDGTRDDEACKRANRRTCSLKWALAHPLEHPNCTRTFAPINNVPAGGFDYGSTNDRIRVRSGTEPNSALLYGQPPTVGAARPGA